MRSKSQISRLMTNIHMMKVMKMPLIQSPKKKAFEKNVETEMKAHPGEKHRAQNLAIAYSIQRKNRKAKGGVVSFGPNRHPNEKEEMLPINYPKSKKFSYAEGGMAEMPEP